MPETKTGNDRFNDSIILLSFSSEIHFQCLVGQVCKKASAIDNRELLEERKGLMNLDVCLSFRQSGSFHGIGPLVFSLKLSIG